MLKNVCKNDTTFNENVHEKSSQSYNYEYVMPYFYNTTQINFRQAQKISPLMCELLLLYKLPLSLVDLISVLICFSLYAFPKLTNKLPEPQN